MTDIRLSPKIRHEAAQEGHLSSQFSDALAPTAPPVGSKVGPLGIPAGSHFVSNDVFPNPIGFLNEFCQKTVTSFPVFNIINKEGPVHSPTFTVECTFKGESFEGHGLSIKKAKDNAACKAIKQLKLDEKDDDIKTSYKLVELGDLENFWNGSESTLKITIRKKEGDSQKFKSFVISKIEEIEEIEEIEYP